MITKWYQFKKIKGCLKKRLSQDHSVRKHYSLNAVINACNEVNIKNDYVVYAVAAYCNASFFYSFLNKNNGNAQIKYKDLRAELDLEKINVDDDFTNPTNFFPP